MGLVIFWGLILLLLWVLLAAPMRALAARRRKAVKILPDLRKNPTSTGEEKKDDQF